MSNIVINTPAVMTLNDKINKFALNRPETVAVIAYGSGVFNQTGTENDKKSIDLIFVVMDLKKWHLENMELNRKDYSLVGRHFFKDAPVDEIKGLTNIAYISDIKENGDIFKYGTIESRDLIHSLVTWEVLYLVGRLHKPILVLKSTPTLDRLLVDNRKDALLVASFLQNKVEVSKMQLLNTVCGLSYNGDIRMTTRFEDSKKVSNIVTGSYDILTDIYDFDTYYSKTDGDIVILDRNKMKDALIDLPDGIFEYIAPYLTEKDEIIQARMAEYFETINKIESRDQTFKGIRTDGPVKSVAYAYRKFLKGLR